MIRQIRRKLWNGYRKASMVLPAIAKVNQEHRNHKAKKARRRDK